jgi:hypothetical protein
LNTVVTSVGNVVKPFSVRELVMTVSVAVVSDSDKLGVGKLPAEDSLELFV